MDRAKALAGEKAGEWVKATQQELTYEACKAWKPYCPTCYQPVHLRKSKKIKSYFAHYDFENKNCPERTKYSQKGGATYSLESHDQDLEEIETFIEQIFYGINPSYFQSLTPEGLIANSDFADRSTSWLLAHMGSSVKKWIQHYCKNNSFLNWNNIQKETNYIMDCLHILSDRESIFKKVIFYSISIYKKDVSLPDELKLKFGLSDTNISEEILTSLTAVYLVIDRLSKLISEGSETNTIDIPAVRTFVDIKFPENTKAIRFKRQSSFAVIHLITFSSLPILVGAQKSQGISYYICFKKGFENRFWFYYTEDESHFEQKQTIGNENDKLKPGSGIMSVYGKSSRTALYRKEEKKQKQKNKDGRLFGYLLEDSLEMYINDLGELYIKGSIEKKLEKAMINGIQKIFFKSTRYSIPSLLSVGFISNNVAEKGAQLALKAEYPDLSEFQALQKLKELTL
ncbi:MULTISPECIES: hypothetical protein [Cyanophyceae]|uniref:Uncharacterized protein n=1 Tax=Leptolyngbya subtilissima DQ-A4 TaxID=2933933 RepID=A0ABV0K1W3_9CYAN|nr:hypothetical protein [Nodosilinea sp. FACHB-141]MBD2112545.1 hypothetical protein [Nodosilinea sp. FACHB-141]